MTTGDRVTLWNENKEVKGTAFKTERIMDSDWVIVDLDATPPEGMSTGERFKKERAGERVRVLAKAVTVETDSANPV